MKITNRRPRTAGDAVTPDHVLVPRDAVQSVVDWWRHANESPGGCSPRVALDGMGDDVHRLHEALEGETQ